MSLLNSMITNKKNLTTNNKAMENKKELSEKDIQALIWLELVNSEKHSLFMDWLNKNFDIKQKIVNNLNPLEL